MNRRSLRLEGSSCLLEVKIKDFLFMVVQLIFILIQILTDYNFSIKSCNLK